MERAKVCPNWEIHAGRSEVRVLFDRKAKIKRQQ